jgi:hypothetical protein
MSSSTSILLGASSFAPGQTGATSVILVDPAPGSTNKQAPAVLKVQFGNSILPPSISSDFELDRIAADGSSTSIATEGNSLTESLDRDPTVIDIATAVPLGAGDYRLVLLASSALKGIDFSSLAGKTDQTVGTFNINPKGVGLSDANDLGSPVSTVVNATGQLNLTEDPGAVGLYKVELPEGHFWRLGVEVNAQAIGSPLLSRLSVFDATGKLVASDVTGLSNTPDDPYIFLGLNPGTYYIGISGIGNVPGQPGGYDIATATAGSSQTGLVSGAYRLGIVADPADSLTMVETVTVDHADPTSEMPTGLTIHFNGPLDELAMTGHQNQLISLIDASGRAWQADSNNYVRGTASLSFLFDQPLPAGLYTVKLGGQGDLVDLSGRAPIAPGLPAATLGSFRLAPYAASSDPTDFGPILPSVALASLTGRFDEPEGESEPVRFFVTQTGFYELTWSYTGGTPIGTFNTGGQDLAFDLGAPGVGHSGSLYVKAGPVELEFVGGKGGTELIWTERFQPI